MVRPRMQSPAIRSGRHRIGQSRYWHSTIEFDDRNATGRRDTPRRSRDCRALCSAGTMVRSPRSALVTCSEGAFGRELLGDQECVQRMFYLPRACVCRCDGGIGQERGNTIASPHLVVRSPANADDRRLLRPPNAADLIGGTTNENGLRRYRAAARYGGSACNHYRRVLATHRRTSCRRLGCSFRVRRARTCQTCKDGTATCSRPVHCRYASQNAALHRSHATSTVRYARRRFYIVAESDEPSAHRRVPT